jgi:hypothetical protein
MGWRALAHPTPVGLRLRGRALTRGPLAEARGRLLRRVPPPPPESARPGRGSGSVRARQRRYLEAVRDGAPSIRHACQAAGISRRLAFWWREVDPVFRRREQLAQEDALDLLRLRVQVRAFAGCDALLLMMVKALVAEYAQRHRTAHVVADDGIPARFSLQLTAPTSDEGCDGDVGGGACEDVVRGRESAEDLRLIGSGEVQAVR